MECKVALELNGEMFFIELIDTLWNVKYGAACTQRLKIDELIDTLWNVKFYKFHIKIIFRVN